MISLTNNSSTSTQKLQAFLSGAAATTNPTCTVHSYIVRPDTKTDYAEYRRSPQFTVLAGATETDIADAPVSGTVKDIVQISIYNTDTASVTVTVCIDDNTTNRLLIKATLLTLETLHYEDGQGWYATDASGARKNTVAGATVNSSQILGTTTNDSASAGRLGEYLETVVASGSAVSLTTNVAKTVATLSLTAGDWNVWGQIATAAGGTVAFIRAGTSQTDNTLDTAEFSAINVGTVTIDMIVPTTTRRVSLAATTTLYLVTQMSFGTSMSAYGKICARRMR